MLLSQTSEYALRIMTTVAVSQRAQPLTAKEIASIIKCPSHYLSKVLRRLVKADLLKGTKGHGGGFLLAKPASKIFFCDIIEAVQKAPQKKHCIFGWRQCNSNKPCVLHHRWNSVSTAFNEWSRKTSLADIQLDSKGTDWLLSKSTL